MARQAFKVWEDFMHLSTHNWMRAEPLAVTLKRIKQFGYESIEISGEPTQYDVKETRALLKEHGIRCWGAVTLTLGERNLAAKDEGQRARSVDYVKSVITMVSELEGEIITLVPATVGKVVPDGTEEEEWKWVVDATRECFAHAQKKGVRIASVPDTVGCVTSRAAMSGAGPPPPAGIDSKFDLMRARIGNNSSGWLIGSKPGLAMSVPAMAPSIMARISPATCGASAPTSRTASSSFCTATARVSIS